MNLKLNPEILQAIRQHPQAPVRVVDEETQKAYLVLAEDALPSLWEQYLLSEVRKGLKAIERGEMDEWDVEATIAEAERRAAARHA